MQQPPTFATNRRVGCIMWLAIMALILAIIGLFLDITQEMAWNQRVEQVLAPSVPITTSSPDQLANENIAPTETLTEQVAAVVIDPPVSESTTTPTSSPIPPSPTPLSTSTPQATWTPVPPGMNTNLIVGNIRWRAVGVEELGNSLQSDNQFQEDINTPGKYVRVTMEIENRQSEPVYYDSPHLMDSQGRRYNSLDMSGMFVPEAHNCTIADLNPGVTVTCADVFEVAADAGGYKLIANNFEWTEPVEGIIELR